MGKKRTKIRRAEKRNLWNRNNNERLFVIVNKKGQEPLVYLFTLWQIIAYGRTMAMSLRIIVPPHPLIAHWLTILRMASTPEPLYETGLEQLGKWLTYEAIRDWLPYRSEEIETLNGKTEGSLIETRVPLLAIPNLPAGLQLWQGARDLLPNANLCLGGIPKEIQKNAGVILFIDEITNGKNFIEYIEKLKELKVNSERIKIITALTSSPGLKNIGEVFTDLTIYSACIDPDLNDKGEISPGIGNPAKRINTRITTSN